jgi:NADH-quinone oxidoreductase subunit J
MVNSIVFWILAADIIFGALGVMVQKNVFRSALSLIMCLVGVAGIFIMLNADFLAGAQVLIYIGAISVIIILAVMLTREYTIGNESNRLILPAAVICLLFFGLVAYFMLRTNWNVSSQAPAEPTTPLIGQQLFGIDGYLLPLEITAVLILATILGSIVIARNKDK